MNSVWRHISALGTTLLVAAACTSPAAAPSPTPGMERIEHVVVIFQENRSFDSLYGFFPGANGIDGAGPAARQTDRAGAAYTALPRPIDNTKTPAVPDPRFPDGIANGPFDLAKYVPQTGRIGVPVHRFYQEQYQINGGRMDRFVAGTDVGGLVMGYYDVRTLPMFEIARQFTVADNFFHGAFGGSFLNHIWLACACAPQWPGGAPAERMAVLDPSGALTKDGDVTPTGYVVNTAYTAQTPHPANVTGKQLLPPLDQPTIGDRLSAKNVSWAWYSGGWNDAIAGRPDPSFAFHHQPYAYFASYADGTPARAEHLKDEADFFAALGDGTLPAVSFVKPIASDSEHPRYADIARGQQHAADLIRAIQNSRHWRNTVVIVTYDENGGFWDHVAPPLVDQWGPGTRVPTLVISPFAKKAYVDHTRYDTTSVLKLIETRWGLAPLGQRDASADGLTGALEFR